ncbi:MAG: hypothetical protein QOE01_2197 [Actinomycetota bacterium]|nr:hypothetical protein [Actinomycetota bacterium]
MSTTTATRADSALLAAVDVARDAAESLAPGQVGELVGSTADGERLVTHFFECLDPAYRGWRWAVTVTRVPRSRVVTVCESVLLPGDQSMLAPAWLPWSERLKPGDLGVGDLLPTREDDDRLEQGYTGTGDEDEDRVAIWELGLGRPRVLSAVGRTDASDRWYSGDQGPQAAIAEAAPAFCASCGFFLLLSGSMRQVFGVCANEYSPSDGKVVSVDHGCGAHSEAVVVPATGELTPPVVDENRYDVIVLRPVDHSPGSVDDQEPGEDLGHS